MVYNFTPKGICARAIQVEIEEGLIGKVVFKGGCPGNAIGLARLVKGRTPEEVIADLRGTRCGAKPTSCPDQLTYALEEALAQI